MFLICSELGVFIYWTHNSVNNLLSYLGLVVARIRASEKDLPVRRSILRKQFHFENEAKTGRAATSSD